VCGYQPEENKNKIFWTKKEKWCVVTCGTVCVMTPKNSFLKYGEFI